MPSDSADSFGVGAFEVARNPDVRQLVDKLNRLREAVDTCRLQPGVGYTVNRSTNGTVLSIDAMGGSSFPPTGSFPFQIKIRTKDGQKQFWVRYGTYLTSHEDDSGYPPIAGLETWMQYEPPANFVLTAKITSNFTISSVSVTAEPREALFQAYKFSGGMQTESREIIGGVDKSNALFQSIKTDRYLSVQAFMGYPVIGFYSAG
ncbi:hypothetical protein EBZ39_10870 [bacterium]|nr:hypothetical protein [bacterium]